MRIVILIIFILLLYGQTGAQTNRMSRHTRDSLANVIMRNEAELQGKHSSTFTAVKGQTGTYENQSRYHSAYFLLYPDSGFVYYRVFEGGYSFTMGTYKVTGAVVSFTWDSLKTMNAVKDKAIYGNYYKYSSPNPHMMIDLQYRIYPDSLVYIRK